MNRLTTLFMAVLAMAVLLAGSALADPPASTFGGTSTDIGVTNSYFVITANGAGKPRVDYLNFTTDKTNTVVTFWDPSTTSVTISATGSSGQAVVTAVGTAFTAGDRCVLRHLTADTYQSLTVSAATSTNITFVQNLGAAVASGDIVYKMTASSTIPCTAAGGDTTASVSGTGIYYGRAGLPTLVEIYGTAASQINAISGIFFRP